MDVFSRDDAASIASLGEKALIRRIRDWLGEAAPPPPFGMGDDCAVLPAETAASNLLTTDSLVLGRHFQPDTLPGLAGAKLVKRNLSDIASMGGLPRIAVVAGFLPARLRIDWLEGFVRGMAGAAMQHRLKIVGGDLTETDTDLAFNLTLLGNAEHPMPRHGGRNGDWICVTGRLGGSRLGRHLRFEPRLREGRRLAASGRVHACIDVSDGLAIDLAAIIPEGSSASLDTLSIPLHEDAARAAAMDGRPALQHALSDGEDHELLFLMEPLSGGEWASFRSALGAGGLAPVSCIGKIVTKGEALIADSRTGAPVDPHLGYDHFG
ncbi:MAG: thiamine-phosphate kinase [Oceanipulchritudo sp.]